MLCQRRDQHGPHEWLTPITKIAHHCWGVVAGPAYLETDGNTASLDTLDIGDTDHPDSDVTDDG